MLQQPDYSGDTELERKLKEALPTAERGSSPGRKVLAAASGAIAGLALALALDYLVPIPLVWLIGPWAGGVIAGRLLAEDGGRYGLVSASLPAASRIVVSIASAGDARREAQRQMNELGRDVPKSFLQPLESVFAPPPSVLALWTALAVLLAFAAGYYGGRYGERLAKGPGSGL